MDPWATAIGVVIGAAISLFGNWLNNNLLMNQQEAQWKREDVKAQREAEEKHQVRVQKEKAEERQVLREIYANFVRYLFSISDFSYRIQKEGYRQEQLLQTMNDFKEAQKYLSLLVIHHSNKAASSYDTFWRIYKEFNDTQDFEDAIVLRQLVLEFAEDDPRLKIGN